MGSNKVLQLALGKTPADELAPNLSMLSARLAGQVGLMFTHMSKEQVRRTGRGLARAQLRTRVFLLDCCAHTHPWCRAASRTAAATPRATTPTATPSHPAPRRRWQRCVLWSTRSLRARATRRRTSSGWLRARCPMLRGRCRTRWSRSCASTGCPRG
jgi:hypothetical protein